MSHPDTPAYPTSEWHYDQQSWIIDGGITARESAAIKLRVPDSGTDWLDAMIERSLLNEFAGKAMQGIVTALTDTEQSAHPDTKDMVADASYRLAQAMLKASKGE